MKWNGWGIRKVKTKNINNKNMNIPNHPVLVL